MQIPPILQAVVFVVMLLSTAMNVFATVKLNGVTNKMTDLFCIEGSSQ